MTAAPVTRPVASPLARTLRYTFANTEATLRDVAFMFFTVVLPVAMFLMFNTIYGKEGHGQAGVGIMTNMAAYGSFGGALSAGAVLQTERANGWLRQLTVGGLQPRGFVIAKIVTAMVVILPAILLVFAAGLTIGGVDLTWGRVLRGVVTLWVAMLPMVVLGVVIALAVPHRAVQGASTLVLMVLSMVGGLWFPAQFFPAWLLAIAKLLPTFWIGVLGQWATLGGWSIDGTTAHTGFPTQGVIVLGAWAVALAVVAALRFRRATRSSKR